jgi:signal transduction histidine kinase
LTYHPDEVLLDVRDDGCGFDPGFETGAAPGHARRSGDRGRGLSGIRHRAEGLGGTATVESAPGEGTTVSVAIPLGGKQ